MGTDFTREACATYARINLEALEWMIARPSSHHPFLDLKVNSITMRDYDRSDGLRSPDYVYGWIQGRGLEALITHGIWLETRNGDLSRRLLARARLLYDALAELVDRDGSACFLYDQSMLPIWPDDKGGLHPQVLRSGYRTPSDAFVAKGLIAAASHFDPDRLTDWLAYLDDIVAAVEQRRFVIAEKQRVDAAAIARQTANYSQHMLLLSAAVLLNRLGLTEAAKYGERLITHVLDHHLHAERVLLSDEVGGDFCNPGHAIEFAGFALAYCHATGFTAPMPTLINLVGACAAQGFHGPGFMIGASIATGEIASAHYPWWTLPEAIRSAAYAYAVSGEPRFLEIWQEAHHRFFAGYWRGHPPYAIQNRDISGPVDVTPATPDLDPLYHTGLSLLAAIEATEQH
jgi:hypothetical protein